MTTKITLSEALDPKAAKKKGKVVITLKPQSETLGYKLALVKSRYEEMANFIPKWIHEQGLGDMVISQAEEMETSWTASEMGVVLSLRVPFPKLAFKQRIAIYPDRIEIQSLLPLRESKPSEIEDPYMKDHNYMLRVKSENCKQKYEFGARIGEVSYFTNKESFVRSLETILFSEHSRVKE